MSMQLAAVPAPVLPTAGQNTAPAGGAARERAADAARGESERAAVGARQAVAMTLGVHPGPPAFFKVGGKAVYVDLDRGSLVTLPGHVQVSHAVAQRAQARRAALTAAAIASDVGARHASAQLAAASAWQLPCAPEQSSTTSSGSARTSGGMLPDPEVGRPPSSACASHEAVVQPPSPELSDDGAAR